MNYDLRSGLRGTKGKALVLRIRSSSPVAVDLRPSSGGTHPGPRRARIGGRCIEGQLCWIDCAEVGTSGVVVSRELTQYLGMS